MLTPAWTSCSMIWEMEVGIMLPRPWKNPRNTPITAKTRMVGAITFRGRALPGLLKMLEAIQSAPKISSTVITPPVTAPKAMPQLNTRSISPFFLPPRLLAICLDTARGRL